ncbi:ATP-binding protein [Ectopseudomonas oleovorans]|uniref:Adenylate kinase n=1 Tax=Ectopseudomonas oleovorans TaxID=301 RepID=A0A3D9EEM8_ECTOL|nr:ATP-binding protein [Pseudomonas oleovorans]RED01301.1 adenylate kinase [Pseudomonas oleovorans]
MTIFVAGIHGVGKTYLCEAFSGRTAIPHRSASALIKSQRERVDWGKDKLVSGIDENQQALATAVGRCLLENADLLLDGHFVLKDVNGSFVRLAPKVFTSLTITAVVLIENTPSVIASRLSERDGTAAAGNISEFLLAEREHSKLVSDILTCPLITLHAPSKAEFHDAVLPLFQRRT